MMVCMQHSGPAESSSDPNLVMRYFPFKGKAGKHLIFHDFSRSTGHCLQDSVQLQVYFSNTAIASKHVETEFLRVLSKF